MEVNKGKEDNMDGEVNVNKEEMPKIGNCEVTTIIMDQYIFDIVRDLDILNLIIGKSQMNKQIQLKLTESIYFFQAQIHWFLVIIFGSWIVRVVVTWHMIEDYLNPYRYQIQVK